MHNSTALMSLQWKWALNACVQLAHRQVPAAFTCHCVCLVAEQSMHARAHANTMHHLEVEVHAGGACTFVKGKRPTDSAVLQAALAEALRQFVRYKIGPGADAIPPNEPQHLGAAAQSTVSSRSRLTPPQGQALHPAQPPLRAPARGSGAAPSGAVSGSDTGSSEAGSDASSSSSLPAPAAAAPDKAPAAARLGAPATGAPRQAPAAAALCRPAAGQQGAGSAAAPKQAPAAAGSGAEASSSGNGTSSGSDETDSGEEQGKP